MLEMDEKQDIDVREELSRRCRSLRSMGRRSWNARPLAEGASEIHVQLTGEWVLMTAAIHDSLAHLASQAEAAWDCLQANLDFAGCAKLVLHADTHRLALAAEVPWSEEEPNGDVHLGQAFDGMTQAGRWRPGSEMEGSHDIGATLDLAALCKSAGWVCNERADGSISVALETQESSLLGGGGLALVEQYPARGVIVRMELLSSQEADLTTPIRLSIARMLLTAGSLVRFARPVAWNGQSRLKAGFEVALGHAVTPARLNTALCALSVAWQLCGREVHALAFQAIAEAFLQTQTNGKGL